MEILTKDLETAQALMEQASRGAKLNFHERNIINIVKKRNKIKPITAKLVLTPSLHPIRGIIKNKKTNKYQMWMGATIKNWDFIFYNQHLLMPDGLEKKALNPQQYSDIIQGKLKNGDSIKLLV